MRSSLFQLDKSNLLHHAYCKYEIELKLLTKGKGVDVIINKNASTDHLEATMNCISMFGMYIFIGTKEADEQEAKIGL